MPVLPTICRHRSRAILAGIGLLGLNACATVGSVMSPYPEKFGCKNSDHGVCIHPEKAYEDAVAGRASRSDPAVTNDKRLLKQTADPAGKTASKPNRKGSSTPTAFSGYRDQVYAELRGLLDQPVTPMLKPSRTVRTLILPYADRQRPDRLYMPRYVYSILDRPEWVVGDYLVNPASQAAATPVLRQVRETPGEDASAPAEEIAPSPEVKP